MHGQKKRFNDILMKILTSFNSNVANWEVCAQDPPLRRSMIHTGARTSETNRIAEAQKSVSNVSQSETLLYHQHLSRPDRPMPRVWNSAIGHNWTDWPHPHTQHQPKIDITIIIEKVIVIIGNDGRTKTRRRHFLQCGTMVFHGSS